MAQDFPPDASSLRISRFFCVLFRSVFRLVLWGLSFRLRMASVFLLAEGMVGISS